MVFRLAELAVGLGRLASVLVSAVAATAAVAAAATAAAALAALAATLTASAAAAAHLFYRHRRLHCRSECPKLHLLAQQRCLEQWMLHHADCARHWSAPDSDLL